MQTVLLATWWRCEHLQREQLHVCCKEASAAQNCDPQFRRHIHMVSRPGQSRTHPIPSLHPQQYRRLRLGNQFRYAAHPFPPVSCFKRRLRCRWHAAAHVLVNHASSARYIQLQLFVARTNACWELLLRPTPLSPKYLTIVRHYLVVVHLLDLYRGQPRGAVLPAH